VELPVGGEDGGVTLELIGGWPDAPAVGDMLIERAPAVDTVPPPVPAPDCGPPLDVLSLPQPINTLARHNALTLGFIASLRTPTVMLF
jgi:hypothetical protein